MKKTFFVTLTILISILLSSCSVHEQVDTDPIYPDSSEEIVYTTFDWPSSEIAKLIPAPESKIGKVEWEADYGFVIYVAETTKDQYDRYVSMCEDAGFTAKYNKGDDYFYGDNCDGYHVSIMLDEGDVMFIRIDEPSAQEGTDGDKPFYSEETQNVSEEQESDVTPEFKEIMDEYEAFFDKYVTFMQKFKEENPNNDMANEFAEYMKQYSETMEKLNEIDETTLTEADAAYYAEVSGRIASKLLTID